MLRTPLAMDDVVLPSAAKLRRLKISPEVAWYLLSRGYELPESIPLEKTPEPSWVPGAQFEPEKVDKVIRAFEAMRHTQGEWAGRPLSPDAWQVAHILAPVFGWCKPHETIPGLTVRIIHNATVDVPRKNGKSTLCGGIALYLTGADGEAGAQVLAAASSMKQAGYVFAPVKQLVDNSPAMKSTFGSTKTVITHRKSFSTFQVVSAVGETLHGANIHGAIIDEIHVHKKGDLIEAIETGVGARAQPLVFKITTADENKASTPYAKNRAYIEKLARKVFRDESTYGVIFAAPRDADPFKESTQRRANPGFGVSPTRAFLRNEAKKARNNPAALASYKRLHLGQREGGATGWIDLREWDRNAGARIHEADLVGRPAYGGLDLGAVYDLSALCWLFPSLEQPDTYDAIWRFYTPEDNLAALDDRTAKSASEWVKDGWLTLTPGNVVDYDFIKHQIAVDRQMFDVQSIGYDRWNSTQLVNDLDEDGLPMIQVGQGYASMNPTMIEMQRLVKLGVRGKVTESRPHLRHGGNPMMRWMIDNLAVDMDPAGNVKPSKKNSAEKIDGVAALLNALFEAMSGDGTHESTYENHGVRSV